MNLPNMSTCLWSSTPPGGKHNRTDTYSSGHCKSLAPEYAKAAQRLAQHTPAYHLAKVDATENKEQADKHGIRGFPTLFFYK